MLYTVECNYTDSETEKVWNDFYSTEKLPALISVTGFLTSQRFKALTPACPIYLAIHTVTDKQVILSEEYQQKGGGNFARWQSYITDWHRNLYETQHAAPTVSAQELLLLSSKRLQFDDLMHSPQPLEMQAIGLDQAPSYRVAYIFPRQQAELIANIADVDLYEAITPQLKNPAYSDRNNEV